MRRETNPRLQPSRVPATVALVALLATTLAVPGLALIAAQPIYSGFVGGVGPDNVSALAVDARGAAYVTGNTDSATGFPARVGPNLRFVGPQDAYVAKVAADGSRLAYCGYIAGTGNDAGDDVAVDRDGNLYVVGWTESSEGSFPVVAGPDLTHAGGRDAFVAKIAPDGRTVLYCGYIGGAADDYGTGVAVDDDGRAWVVGYTLSDEATFPVAGDLGRAAGGGYDAFVARVAPDGSSLDFCGYVGGGADDFGMDVAAGPDGGAVLVGVTSSPEPGLPVAGGPDLTYNGGVDGFVARVAADGSALLSCGYLGGAGDDRAIAVAVDGGGAAVVVGSTESSEASFPTAVGPDLTHNGGVDGFVARLAPTAERLVACGFLGGASADHLASVAVDGRGVAYVAGTTRSDEASFPVAVGPDLTHNGANDAFVAAVAASSGSLLFCGYVGGSDGDEGRGVALDPLGNVYLGGWAMSTESTFPVRVGPALTHATSWDGFISKLGPLGADARFSLAADPETTSGPPGSRHDLTIRVARNGSTGRIRVAARAAPPGIRVKPRSRDAAGDEATFTVRIKRSAVPGTYRLTFTGSDGTGSLDEATVTVVVE